jgi:hypothetical protein
MRTEYFITMDTHCRTTDVCVKTRRGKAAEPVDQEAHTDRQPKSCVADDTRPLV